MKNKFLFSVILVLMLVALVLPVAPLTAAPPPPPAQTPLSAISITQFVDELPILDITGATNGSIKTVVAGNVQIVEYMQEFKSYMLPKNFVLPNGTAYSGTWVWGYRPETTAPTTVQETYTGPVVVTTKGQPTEIKFVNNLGSTTTTNILAYKNSTDQSLHWANPNMVDRYVTNPVPPPNWVGNPSNYSGPIPAAVHLHGGEVPAALDGGPDSWFLSDGSKVGSAFYSKGWDGVTPQNFAIYRYPNNQEAAPIWFHDHTLGATRLNVYMGLAGGYLLTDPGLTLPTGLTSVGLVRPGGDTNPLSTDNTIIPLVVQDRMFDTNGQLYFPNVGINPDHPYWVPEFIGDTICVNGKSWPYLNVKAQRYRFLFVNGSNARTYTMSFTTPGMAKPPVFWQIETDGGYLDKPVPVPSLTIMPGERADVIVDFTGLAPGTNLILDNSARAPYPGGAPPKGATTGRVMQFRVIAGAPATDTSFIPTASTTLRSPMVRLVNATAGTLGAGVTANLTRELTLNEIALPRNKVGGVQYPGGPVEILVNNTHWDGMRPDPANPNSMVGTVPPGFGATPDRGGNFLSELPNEGATEIWEIVNLTADAHPIHLHLAQFQLMNRQNFDVAKYFAFYGTLFPGGVFTAAYGPPLAYNTLNTSTGNKYGGNPDATPYLLGLATPPNTNEAGWKDTIMVPPGMVTRFVVRWVPTTIPIGGTGGDSTTLHFATEPNWGNYSYVWHCHIVDHEDNEMMRPDQVVPMPGATRTYVQGVDY